jgi:hypothetical protein
MTNKIRYVVAYDEYAEFEECNGEPRPLTAEEYIGNEYYENGEPVLYDAYLRYQGNPERHVYLTVTRQDQCACCGTWTNGESLSNIDCMDDHDEAFCIGTFAYEELIGYLKDVAGELEGR